MMKFWYLRDPFMMDPGTLFLAGAAATVAGAGTSAYGTIAGGNAAANQYYRQANQNRIAAAYGIQEAQNEAQQLKWAANESRAASQQKALEISGAAGMAKSKLQAAAAFGGGSARDATVGQLGAGIQQAGEFQKLMEMYGGESRARGLEDSANVASYRGAMKNYDLLTGADTAEMAARTGQTNAALGAAGTILGTAGSVGMNYAQLNRPPRYY